VKTSDQDQDDDHQPRTIGRDREAQSAVNVIEALPLRRRDELAATSESLGLECQPNVRVARFNHIAATEAGAVQGADRYRR
jgi:hypothetical protein